MIEPVAPPSWQPLLPADAPAVRTLADSAHPGLPERTEVFAEKIRLCPAGCRKLVRDARLAGYGLAHPWHLDQPPPVDAFLGSLPASADCLHLHDVVIAPELRGNGCAAAYIDEMTALARSLGLSALALVSVYGTHRLWSRCGFAVRATPALAAKLATYGPSACYMIRPL